MRKECVVCGGEFEARRDKLCCSAFCLGQRKSALQRTRRALKEPSAKVCAICGQRFTGPRVKGRSKTCSDECGAELRRVRREIYLARYKVERAEVIRAGNASYYQKIRDDRRRETAEATAAMRLLRKIEKGEVIAPLNPRCAVCGTAFRPKSKSTLCDRSGCRSEWSRLSALKRHHGKPMPTRPAGRIRLADRDDGYVERQREYQKLWRRDWRARNPGANKDAQRRSYAKRTAALKAVRNILGQEALL